MTDKDQPHLEPGIYEHFKGGRYEVINVAVNQADDDANEWSVNYYKLGETGLRLEPPLWRRYELFVEPAQKDGQTTERYRKVDT